MRKHVYHSELSKHLLSFNQCCYYSSNDLKDETNVFNLGVNLPYYFTGHEIVASKDNKYLYTIGNYHSSNNMNIFKFECTNSITNCSWTKIATKLQYGRSRTVAIPLPDSMANKLCKGIVLTTESYLQA